MDGIIAVALSGVLVGVSALAKLPYWSIFWVGVTIWLGFMEWLAKKRTGKTISQQMWACRKTEPKKFWLAWVVYAFFFGFLLAHLIGAF